VRFYFAVRSLLVGLLHGFTLRRDFPIRITAAGFGFARESTAHLISVSRGCVVIFQFVLLLPVSVLPVSQPRTWSLFLAARRWILLPAHEQRAPGPFPVQCGPPRCGLHFSIRFSIPAILCAGSRPRCAVLSSPHQEQAPPIFLRASKTVSRSFLAPGHSVSSPTHGAGPRDLFSFVTDCAPAVFLVAGH
jgi:hypothetical protein